MQRSTSDPRYTGDMGMEFVCGCGSNSLRIVEAAGTDVKVKCGRGSMIDRAAASMPAAQSKAEC
jgi:hypothetical protein